MARLKELGLRPGGFCAATPGVVRAMIRSRKCEKTDLFGEVT